MSGGIRAEAEGYKPFASMVAVQCIFAVSALWIKAVFRQGMNPMVLVVYRQGIATLVLAPITIMANRTKLKEMRLGWTGFFTVFVAAFIGATAFMNLCYEGLHLGSPSMATAMMNLTPAITFLMAATAGQERVNIREANTIAKIFGTAICVGGAVTMALFKGPNLLNFARDDLLMLLHSSSSKWMIGALMLAGASCCWSLWLIMQGPICKLYMDPLTLSTWACLLSTLQSAMLAFFVLPNWSAWKINSLFVLSCCIFIGIGRIRFIRKKEAKFFADTILGLMVEHRALSGAVGIVFGLYMVLWGKAEDVKKGRAPIQSKDTENTTANINYHINVENNFAAPLLVDTPSEHKLQATMEAYMPAVAMVATQCIYSTVALWAKSVFTGGMRPT
ncbi:hypothetical protein EJB05_43092 [Eragrostis curvula]|uniref:WAT1-related protein n=1 Tax=Eragrostis curvula TaxID=38414 RepID=A0A5J9TF19_9POAL|nr:hypothetical protein EJB05_43092 [Eragrostis curvula]